MIPLRGERAVEWRRPRTKQIDKHSQFDDTDRKVARPDFFSGKTQLPMQHFALDPGRWGNRLRSWREIVGHPGRQGGYSVEIRCAGR